MVYINSRARSLNFQRILSGHSVSYQVPFSTFASWLVTTVQSATVHQCDQAAAQT